MKEERKLKEKLRQQEQADNDETSSTTTESSSAEVEEKVRNFISLLLNFATILYKDENSETSFKMFYGM